MAAVNAKIATHNGRWKMDTDCVFFIISYAIIIMPAHVCFVMPIKIQCKGKTFFAFSVIVKYNTATAFTCDSC